MRGENLIRQAGAGARHANDKYRREQLFVLTYFCRQKLGRHVSFDIPDLPFKPFPPVVFRVSRDLVRQVQVFKEGLGITGVFINVGESIMQYRPGALSVFFLGQLVLDSLDHRVINRGFYGQAIFQVCSQIVGVGLKRLFKIGNPFFLIALVKADISQGFVGPGQLGI